MQQHQKKKGRVFTIGNNSNQNSALKQGAIRQEGQASQGTQPATRTARKLKKALNAALYKELNSNEKKGVYNAFGFERVDLTKYGYPETAKAYYVNRDGKAVYSAEGNNANRLAPLRIFYKRAGREAVKLCFKDGKRRGIKLSRIIAMQFVPNDDPAHKTVVHHKDGNVHNNAAYNLQWVTPEEHRALHKEMKLAKKKAKEG